MHSFTILKQNYPEHALLCFDDSRPTTNPAVSLNNFTNRMIDYVLNPFISDKCPIRS